MHQLKTRGKRLHLGWLLKELVLDGTLTQADANSIAAKQRSADEALVHPLEIIASRQCCHAKTSEPLSVTALCQWLAARVELEFAALDPLKINVPVNATELVVATAEPFDQSWIESLEQTSHKTLRRVLAKPGDIEKYRLEFYSLAKSVFGAGTAKTAAGMADFEQLLEVGKLKDPDAQDQHIVNIVDWLLQYAFEQRASDIHLEPRRDKGKVRFRIDGILHLVYELPDNVMTAMVSRLKILGRMDLAEKRRPQDGRIKTVAPNSKEVELRLSTMPTAFGEKLVMRIFDPEVLLRNFTQLGLVDQDYIHWRAMTLRSHGIVLVTGPTGSGKTTTLYSTLKSLAEETVNVSTIEDPIEMVVDAFNQSQIQPAIDFDFAAGIRTLMRQDPDIIMVGEIRDRETAEMAVQAALTGHLVLSTLHTNDAPSAISRLLDLGMPAHLLKATLNGVMAQRLLRTLCLSCRVEVAPDQQAWQELVQSHQLPMPSRIYQPGGCLDCRNTGYSGRQGVYEIMPLSKPLIKTISATGDIQSLRDRAVKIGMVPLRLAGAEKVIRGITSIEEVMRVTPEPES